jgi:hypothetical protein
MADDPFALFPPELILKLTETLLASHSASDDSVILWLAASPTVLRTLYRDFAGRCELRRLICASYRVDESAKARVATPGRWTISETVNCALHDACASCGVRGRTRLVAPMRARLCGLCTEWFLVAPPADALVTAKSVVRKRKYVDDAPLRLVLFSQAYPGVVSSCE